MTVTTVLRVVAGGGGEHVDSKGLRLFLITEKCGVDVLQAKERSSS